MKRNRSAKKVGTERHSRLCRVCNSPDRDSIERDFVSWERPSAICKRYGLRSRTTLALHTYALRLNDRRDGNIRGFLSRFLERGAGIKPTAASLMTACTILSKLDGAGKLVDTVQFEKASNPLFERMSRIELLEFARTGSLPSWVTPEERTSIF